MQFYGTPGFGDLGVATAATFVLGYLIAWAMDRLLLKWVIDDRVAGIALSCALTFVLLMGGATYALTTNSPFPHRPIIIPPLGYAISFVVGLALAGALRMHLYAREYEHNDDQGVFEVDLNDLSLYDDEVLAADERHGHKNYLRRHWAGHLSLPISYWINGALLSALIVAATEFLTEKLRSEGGSLRNIAFVALLFLVISALFWVWSSVGIWRSAYWHRRRGGSPGWGLAARTLILVSAAATLFRSGDIALQAAELGNLATGNDSLGAVAEMKASEDGRDIILHGTLSEGAAERFEKLLQASPDARNLVLTSPGGRMLEAERMAAMIRQRRLNTRVDDHCMSACISLLLAGRERTAPNLARIGFHQPSFPGLNGREMHRAIEATRDQYIAAGVDPALVWRAMATPADGMWFPTADELVDANVLTSADIVLVGSRRGSGGSPRGAPRELSLGEQRLRDDLRAEAARINATAPVKIDSVTTLDRASASAFTLTTHYSVRMDNLDLAASKPELASILQQDLCGRPQTAAALRDGVRFVHSYRNAKGKLLFDIAVSQCPAGEVG